MNTIPMEKNILKKTMKIGRRNAMKRMMMMVLVLMMVAAPAVAENRLAVGMLNVLLTQLLEDNGEGLFDPNLSMVFEDDGEVCVVFYSEVPYRLFMSNNEVAIKFVRDMWLAFDQLLSTMSDAPMVVMIYGGDSVYLITDGETVYDGVLEQIVYTGLGV
jgi:hypothetical protein